MSVSDKINELNSCRNLIDASGNSNSKNGFSARYLIELLIDPGSFIELGAFACSQPAKNTPADGVITGFATVSGRLVYVYSQNSNVLGGSVGISHAKKICAVYEMALKVGAPVIAIMNSSGLRIDEDEDGLAAYGAIFSAQVKASGVIPQISIVVGDCMGALAFSPALSDFVFMCSDKSKMFLSSANVIISENNSCVSFEDVGSGSVHSKVSGLVDFYSEDVSLCFSKVHELISYLPSNNLEEAPCNVTGDDLNRLDESLNSIIPDDIKVAYEVRDIITSVSDSNQFFEIKKDFSQHIVVGFSRFDAVTVGVIANSSSGDKACKLDIDSLQKASDFVNFCDAFNIPILTITDVSGFYASLSEEHRGIIRNSARFIHILASATVPKINLVIRQGYGSSYLLMNSKHVGADIVFAWPTAIISPISPEAYVSIMNVDDIKKSGNQKALLTRKIEEYEKNVASPYAAAKKCYVDDIIVPSETRPRIIGALQMLSSKRELKYNKKHSSVVF